MSDQQQPAYRKTFNRPDLKWQKQRVIDFLKKLHGVAHFPDLIAVDEYAIYMDDCGTVNCEEVPPTSEDLVDVGIQLREIISLLEGHGIRHRDITANNLMWKNGVLWLVDFGWSCWAAEKDTPEPVPDVMRWWMDKTDKEQAAETLEKFRVARED